MVAATLVDIIRRFKVNKSSLTLSKQELYEDFPEKVGALYIHTTTPLTYTLPHYL